MTCVDIVKQNITVILPYLILPCGEMFYRLASNCPIHIPELTIRLQKSPSAILTWVHTNTWNHPLPREGLLTGTYLLTCTLGISKRISAQKHLRTSILITMTSKTPNQETRVPSPSTPCISLALLCNQGAFSKHTLYIDSTSYPLRKSASGEKTRRHLLSSAGPSRNPVVSPNRARVTTLVDSQPQTPNGIFRRCLALTHLELDRKLPSHS